MHNEFEINRKGDCEKKSGNKAAIKSDVIVLIRGS